MTKLIHLLATHWFQVHHSQRVNETPLACWNIIERFVVHLQLHGRFSTDVASVLFLEVSARLNSRDQKHACKLEAGLATNNTRIHSINLHSPRDYRTTQAGMHHQSPPFMGPFASNVPTGVGHHSQYYQGPLSHPPPVAHSVYPPPYQQLPLYPLMPCPPATSSHCEIGRHHIMAKSRDLPSNLFSLSITARFDLDTEGVVNALDQLGTFWPHAFVLYTHADDMGSTESEQKQQIYQWINNPRCPERLKWLL